MVRSLRAVGSPGGRGRLHVYLGTAPAVGKSYAMLGEGRRLAASGTDVVVGYLESHSDEADLFLDALLVVPPKAVSYRGTTFTEMDLDAILLRSPRVVLVDELAHSNAPGQRHAKRWQDVEELLDAGIDVISNLNVQHLDSLHDEVERLTAVPQRETVPDIVVASADRVELIDLEPEALRERVKRRTDSASTNSEVALGRWFTVENINALHDLAVSWMARHARSDEPGQPAPPRASVVVSLDAGRRGDELVRRAAQIARRDDARLIGVHVCVPTGLRESDNGLESRRRLLAELGGNYAEVGALDRGDTLMIFAADQRATEVVVGSPKRTRLHRLLHGAELDRLVEAAPGGIELHVVAIDDGPPAPLPESSPTPRPRLSPRRRLIAWAVALIGPVAVTFSLTPWRASLGLAGVLLALLLVTAATGPSAVSLRRSPPPRSPSRSPTSSMPCRTTASGSIGSSTSSACSRLPASQSSFRFWYTWRRGQACEPCRPAPKPRASRVSPPRRSPTPSAETRTCSKSCEPSSGSTRSRS